MPLRENVSERRREVLDGYRQEGLREPQAVTYYREQTRVDWIARVCRVMGVPRSEAVRLVEDAERRIEGRKLAQ